MSIDPTLYEGYFGPNEAHRMFKAEIIGAKVLLLQINASREHLKADFTTRMGQGLAFGMVTEVLSPIQFRALNIPHNEARLIAQDYAALEKQFFALLYVDLQRILESFLIDLYVEIARKDPRILRSNKTVTFEEVLKEPEKLLDLLLEKQRVSLSHSDLEKPFSDLGLQITAAEVPQADQEFFDQEFRMLWSLRNVLQHNHGVINELFVKKQPQAGYVVGDRVTIDVARLGRAFAVVEGIADDINRRAVSKYALTA